MKYTILIVLFCTPALYGMYDIEEEYIGDMGIIEGVSDKEYKQKRELVENLYNQYKQEEYALREDMQRGVGGPYHARLQLIKNLFNQWKAADKALNDLSFRSLPKRTRMKQKEDIESLPS